ncbi:hypothetical protein [Streptomyces sp. uw30]|uniref:hypothetical protein n=1 Tax=Streptomyces sp. uw30 TaxID=1828179 RepID=UPI001650D584|nr:hypothetical protein [Streptomyces sp. uw30]
MNSPSMPARELTLSVRTLHRVFEAAVAGHVRGSRLEGARLELLIRAFKSRNGHTPAELARPGVETGSGQSPVRKG